MVLRKKYPEIIEEIRGAGFLIGMRIKPDANQFKSKLAENGMLTVPAGENVIRLLPPLNATPEDLKESVSIIEKTITTWKDLG